MSTQKRKTSVKKPYKKATKNGVYKPSLNRQNAILVERKSVDLAITGDLLTTGTFVTAFGTTQQGSSAQNRIGRKVVIDTIQFNGFWNVIGASTPALYTKMAIVFHASGATTPAASDIWQGFLAGGSAVTSIATAGRNLNNSDKYRVLAVRDFLLSPNAPLMDTSRDSKIVNWFLKGLSLKQKYSGSAAGDLVSGGLYIVCVSETAATAGTTFTGTVRIRYTDC